MSVRLRERRTVISVPGPSFLEVNREVKSGLTRRSLSVTYTHQHSHRHPHSWGTVTPGCKAPSPPPVPPLFWSPVHLLARGQVLIPSRGVARCGRAQSCLFVVVLGYGDQAPNTATTRPKSGLGADFPPPLWGSLVTGGRRSRRPALCPRGLLPSPTRRVLLVRKCSGERGVCSRRHLPAVAGLFGTQCFMHQRAARWPPGLQRGPVSGTRGHSAWPLWDTNVYLR